MKRYMAEQIHGTSILENSESGTLLQTNVGVSKEGQKRSKDFSFHLAYQFLRPTFLNAYILERGVLSDVTIHLHLRN